MPYSSNDKLPTNIRNAIPSAAGRTLFRRVVNSQLRNGKSESVAFASAWSAMKEAGYSAGRKKPYKKAYGAKPVYGMRPVLNAEEICVWAKEQGFTSCLQPDDMHVTVLYSRRPFSVDLTQEAEEGWKRTSMYGNIVVKGGERSIMPLGDRGAVVMKIEDNRLHSEWEHYNHYGASWDFPEYQPHVTLTYSGAPEDLDLIEPFPGPIVLGHTQYFILDDDWQDDINELDLQYYEKKRKKDTFPLPYHAVLRSRRLGLGGEYHMNSEGLYTPGKNRAAYLKAVGKDDDEQNNGYDTESMFTTFISTVMSGLFKQKEATKPVNDPEQVPNHMFMKDIIKVDDEKQIVWGWASVTTYKGEPVVDHHGDVIETSTIVDAADEFMMYNRTAKAMHQGKGIGVILHSFPYTHALGKALGVESEMEGWIIAMKVLDEDHWARVKSGEFRGFSFGGRGNRVEINE